MSPYQVRTYENLFTMFELVEEATASHVTVCPERGGIITGYTCHGIEQFYFDWKTFEDTGVSIRGGESDTIPDLREPAGWTI